MDFQALNAFDEWTLNPNFSYDVDEDEESDFEDFIDEIIYNEELGVQVKKEKKRRVKNNYLDIDPKATVWYFFYILYPDTCNQKFNKYDFLDALTLLHLMKTIKRFGIH